MLTHSAVGTNDLDGARAFYDKVLGALGYSRTADFGDAGSAWGLNGSVGFLVMKPANEQPATVGNGVTICFAAPDRASVAAFHAAALGVGGVDEGAVGPRGWAPNAFAGYCRDLDGNKLAAYSFTPD